MGASGNSSMSGQGDGIERDRPGERPAADPSRQRSSLPTWGFQVDPQWLRRTIRRKADRLTWQLRTSSISAEDLEQELDLHLWQLRGRYDVPASETPRFLRRVLDRKGISLLRHYLSRRRCPRDPRGHPAPPSSLNPEATHWPVPSRPSGTETEGDLEAAVARLSPWDRELFAALRQHSITEIARQRGVSRSVIYRELEQIVRQLNQSSQNFSI